ncbi:uncharacterized protein LOC122928435 isoform X1 [Bufo gargarizans]|uniref:uncharacterized protein LOC122928435 isoform X1 n=1 Tax=Bufo gargarizans TaxID=30331 RepID=UPI001CF14523|nr:uncharacterized protein LOC122928435 isoform X1 [Bufo gargarizans]
MGEQHHNRGLKVAVSRSSSSKIYSDKGIQEIIRRGRSANREKGVSPSAKNRTGKRLLFHTVLSQKTGWILPYNYKFEAFEQTSNNKKVQDGDHKICDSFGVPGLLYGSGGSKGCILTYPDASPFSKIPKGSSDRGYQYQTPSVPGYAFRPSNCPENLYQGNGGGSVLHSERKHLIPSLFGRSLDYCGITGNMSEISPDSNSDPGKAGVDDQLQKIKVGTQHKSNISGSSVRFSTTKDFPTSRKDREDPERSPQGSAEPRDVGQESNVSIRINDGLYPSSPLGSVPFKDVTMGDFKLDKTKRDNVRLSDMSQPEDTELPQLVAKGEKLRPGHSMELPQSSSNHYGRQSLGVGCTFSGSVGAGNMVPGTETVFIQQEGIKGSVTGFTNSPARTPAPTCQSDVGQQYSGFVSEPPRGYQIPIFDEGGRDNILRVRGRANPHIRPTYKGERKCPGRLPEPSSSKTGGVVSESSHIHKDCGSVGSARNRSICHQGEQTGREVLLPQSLRIPLWGRRLPPGLDIPPRLCLSPPTAPTQSSQEDKGREVGHDSHRPLLAKKSLVLPTQIHVDSGTMGPSRLSGSPEAGPSNASRDRIFTSNGVEIERVYLIRKGFSEALTSTMLSSRKRVTNTIYARIWKRFLSFSGIDTEVWPEKISTRQVLEFLQRGLSLGLAKSTLKVQVSALSALSGRSLAMDPWVVRFFRAVDRVAPVRGPRFPPWDLNLVLKALTSPPFEPMVESSIRNLTLKLVMLIALTSARRVSELQAVSINPPFMSIREDRVILRPDPKFIPKVPSRTNRVQEIVLPVFFPDPKTEEEDRWHLLDVRRCLIHYLERSKDWRKTSSLFVLFAGARKGNTASKSTIARWIRELISLAYSCSGLSPPLSLKAHSTRAMSTSWAERSNVSIVQICRAATWASPSTFYKHYRLQLDSVSDLLFGTKVLEVVTLP